MLKIEKRSDGQTTVVCLIGRVQFEHLDGLREQIKGPGSRVILDLNQVTLVDAEVIRFLSSREKDGIELSHCPPYVREWIARERAEGY